MAENDTPPTDRPATDRPPTYDVGLEIRRAVLGAEYVDRAVQNADDFTRPLQDLVTSYCWGDVWARPGLERRERSMLNLAMLTALGKMHELRLHVRGAIANGLTPAEISEVLLQTAIYCGVPAAVEAFRNAHDELKQIEAI